MIEPRQRFELAAPSLAPILVRESRQASANRTRRWRALVGTTAAVATLVAALVAACRFERWRERHMWVVWRGDDVQLNDPCNPCDPDRQSNTKYLLELRDRMRSRQGAIAFVVLDGLGIATGSESRVTPEAVDLEVERCLSAVCVPNA